MTASPPSTPPTIGPVGTFFFGASLGFADAVAVVLTDVGLDTITGVDERANCAVVMVKL